MWCFIQRVRSVERRRIRYTMKLEDVNELDLMDDIDTADEAATEDIETLLGGAGAATTNRTAGSIRQRAAANTTGGAATAKSAGAAAKTKPVQAKTKSAKSEPAKKSSKQEKKSSGGFLSKIGVMDIVIGFVGILVVILFVFFLVFWTQDRNRITDLGEFATVGEALSSLKNVGKNGIDRVVSSVSSGIEGESTVTDATGQVVSISVSFTSICKDLKIKFTNRDTQKLLEGTAFTIQAVAPDNEELQWTDDDADGMIYMEDLDPGIYMITIQSVDGYTFPEEATKVIVQDDISYVAINILDEVKTEDEINASKEDGETNEASKQEDNLQDTVEWVESSKICVSGADGYAPIDKSKIPSPSTLVSSADAGKVAAGVASLRDVMENKGAKLLNMKVGETITVSPDVTEDSSKYQTPYEYKWTVPSTDAALVTIADDKKSATVTALANGYVDLLCTVKMKYPSPSEAYDEDTYGFSITVEASESSEDAVTGIKLDTTSKTVKAGESFSLTATVIGTGSFDKTVTWSTSDESVATVLDGKVTGLKAGSATITATTVKNSEGKNFTATCAVTVSEKGELKLTLKEKKATVPVKTTYQIEATVENYLSDKGVTYTSADEKIATVNEKGVVTGVKQGKVEITVKTKEKGSDGKVLSAKVEITVTANPQADTKTPLKDASGNQVYVKGSDGKYKAAVWADYYTASAFYLEAEPVYKYTGWQTMNGKTYFYDKNGSKVTGVQVILGVKYTFGSDGALSMNGGVLGIDVSKYQTEIDWKTVKNSGISYVIIRCGYRGYSTGVLVQDPMFEKHISGATSAGLKVGIYFFSQAINEKEAVEEASMAVALARKYSVTYPIFIDTEAVSGGRANSLDGATRTAVCKAFCETVKSAGYTPGVYANKTWLEEKVNMNELSDYKVWLAQYASKPSYSGKYDMWQYTETGKVTGVKGNVDMNISYMGY